MAGPLRFLVLFLSLSLYAVSSESACPSCKNPAKCDLVIGNTNTVCRHDSIGLTRFQSSSKLLQICDGQRWLQVPLDGTAGLYGGRHNPALSCNDIYQKAKQSLPNGVYWIKMTGQGTSFPVYCDMLSGGWTMVFKAVSGVPSVAGDLWLNPLTSYEDTLQALDVTNNFKKHYKNRIIKHWTTFNPIEARVVLYKNQREVVQLKFNAKGSSNANWYAVGRMVESPWTDITTAPKNVFSIKGTCHPLCRSFMINNRYGGCPNDAGWLTMTVRTCPWERRYPFATILYSNIGTNTNWNRQNNVGKADVMAVYVR